MNIGHELAGLGQDMNTGDRAFTDYVIDESPPESDQPVPVAAGSPAPEDVLVDTADRSTTGSIPGPVTATPSATAVPGNRAQAASSADRAPRLTRASAAWAAITVALVLAVVLIVFVLQNPTIVVLHFLWFTGSVAVGMAMLIAAVAGGIFVAAIGVARLTQLSVRAHRTRRQPAKP